ncbi:hypothetical protein DBT_2182 [Dissulfuribacter thermophilus]|uniref:Uncharacterized protein n=1 Tax=Dissulfuribacter thermophilus TaxID=1156395 RepID=A0A1B9F3L2_9BACT|nr:hypothetical protein DBT_2182 [Dissulfuribacter thermophilus]
MYKFFWVFSNMAFPGTTSYFVYFFCCDDYRNNIDFDKSRFSLLVKY